MTGRFKPGTSGNPKGRPRGRTNDVLNAIKKEFGSEPEFWQHLAKAAREGDAPSMGFLVARVKAPFKARSACVELDIQGNTASDYTTGVLDAVATGQLPPDEASALLSAILAGDKIEKLEALEAKVDELLRAKNANP